MNYNPRKIIYNPTIYLLLIMAIVLVGCKQSTLDPNKEEWISLFDGSNIDNWTPKFKGSELGVNYKNRFAVKDSLLSVRYAAIDTFNEDFGHLYYKDKFSHYKLRAKYRFIGEQQTGGPGWAIRNNGLMLHCQEPSTIGLDQDFPISTFCVRNRQHPT